MQLHDELVYAVRVEPVADFKAPALEGARRRPDRAPALPLEAEAGVGSSYGEAKDYSRGN